MQTTFLVVFRNDSFINFTFHFVVNLLTKLLPSALASHGRPTPRAVCAKICVFFRKPHSTVTGRPDPDAVESEPGWDDTCSSSGGILMTRANRIEARLLSKLTWESSVSIWSRFVAGADEHWGEKIETERISQSNSFRKQSTVWRFSIARPTPWLNCGSVLAECHCAS